MGNKCIVLMMMSLILLIASACSLFNIITQEESADTSLIQQEEAVPIESPVAATQPQAPTQSLSTAVGGPLNPTPPSSPWRLVFIHHSTGEDWLKPDGGNLRQALNDNNYYVTDTNYCWGPEDTDVNDRSESHLGQCTGHNVAPIGYHTDMGHWYNWFLGENRDVYLNQLFNNTLLSDGIGANTIDDPGGENSIILFKSCFSSGQTLLGQPGDPPRQSSPQDPNPLWGLGVCDDDACSGSEFYTLSNVKGLYRDLLTYFASRSDKLFILITTPPSHDQAVPPDLAANLRDLNSWLIHDWLDDYPLNNVAAFDYYNILTSNGGNANTNDLGAETGNHHRFRNGQVEHLISISNDFLAYPSEGPDNHPTPAGHQKATGEFIDLLNIIYHCWQGDGGCPSLLGRE